MQRQFRQTREGFGSRLRQLRHHHHPQRRSRRAPPHMSLDAKGPRGIPAGSFASASQTCGGASRDRARRRYLTKNDSSPDLPPCRAWAGRGHRRWYSAPPPPPERRRASSLSVGSARADRIPDSSSPSTPCARSRPPPAGTGRSWSRSAGPAGKIHDRRDSPRAIGRRRGCSATISRPIRRSGEASSAPWS